MNLKDVADRPGRVLAIGAAASAALIGGAHLFERVGGFAPCRLCLDQREAHWTALGLALVSLAATRSASASASAIGAAAIGALALVYAFSAALAGFHAGVEWGFWPGPPTCSGAGAAGAPGDLLADLQGAKPVVSCSDAPWRLFGTSMAGYNALVSAGLFGLCAAALARLARKERAFA